MGVVPWYKCNLDFFVVLLSIIKHKHMPNKKSLKDVIEYTDKIYNGKCLSETYINAVSLMDFECANKHVFQSYWSNIQSGHWCPHCVKKAKPTIQQIQEKIQNKGGVLLSTIYHKNTDKLNVQCEYGHLFFMSWNSLSQNRWCPICANKGVINIDSIKKYIHQKHKGELISEIYINSSNKLKIKCSVGHIFNTTWNIIQSKHWCPFCANVVPPSIVQICEFVHLNYNGLFLSNDYESKVKLNFKCKNKHEFQATWNSVQSGHWCPKCKRKGEEFIRNYFEQLFNYPFVSARHKWLRNPKTNAPLELDGYCAELNLAFEYQSRQHYQPESCFGGDENFYETQEKDKFKKQRCKELGVVLIEIPELHKYIKPKDVYAFIKDKLNDDQRKLLK